MEDKEPVKLLDELDIPYELKNKMKGVVDYTAKGIMDDQAFSVNFNVCLNKVPDETRTNPAFQNTIRIVYSKTIDAHYDSVTNSGL